MSGAGGRSESDTAGPVAPIVTPRRDEQPGEVGAHPRRVEVRVGGGQPARDVGEVGHAREVDVGGAPSGLPQPLGVGEQHAGLAVPARGRQAHVDAVGGTARQQVELVRAVDQQREGDRALERERRALSVDWSHRSEPDGITLLYQTAGSAWEAPPARLVYRCASGPLNVFVLTALRSGRRLASSKSPVRDRASVIVAWATPSDISPSARELRFDTVSPGWW